MKFFGEVLLWAVLLAGLGLVVWSLAGMAYGAEPADVTGLMRIDAGFLPTTTAVQVWIGDQWRAMSLYGEPGSSRIAEYQGAFGACPGWQRGEVYIRELAGSTPSRVVRWEGVQLGQEWQYYMEDYDKWALVVGYRTSTSQFRQRNAAEVWTVIGGAFESSSYEPSNFNAPPSLAEQTNSTISQYVVVLAGLPAWLWGWCCSWSLSGACSAGSGVRRHD